MPGLQLIVGAEASKYLNDRAAIVAWIEEAVRLAGMHILGQQSHLLPTPDDSGPGVTAIAVIAESHVAVHTWPEERLVRMDFYSCRSFDTAQVFGSFCLTFGVSRVLQQVVLERA